MSRFTKLDSMLISEAYSSQILLESAPYMTIAEIQAKLPYMTIAEAQVIEELFGKLGQRLGRVASGVANVGGAAGKGLQAAGKSAMGAVDRGIEKAGQVGSGLAAAAGQVGKNVQDMYKTGDISKQTSDAVKSASGLAMELIDLVKQAQQNGLVKSQGDVTDMSLADIMDELETAGQSASKFQQNANKTGFTGGVGSAFKKGFQGGSQGSPPASAGVPQTP